MVRQEMKTTNFTERRVEKSVTKRPNTKMRVLKNLFTEIYTHGAKYNNKYTAQWIFTT